MKRTISILGVSLVSITLSAQKLENPLILQKQLKENNIKYIYKTDINYTPEGDTIGLNSHIQFYTILENGRIEYERDSIINGDYLIFNVYHYNDQCNLVSKVESFKVDFDNKTNMDVVHIDEYSYLPSCALSKIISTYPNENNAKFEYHYIHGIEAEYIYKIDNKLETHRTSKYISENTIEIKLLDENNKFNTENIQQLTYHKDWEKFQYYIENEMLYEYTAKNVYLNHQLLSRFLYDEEGKMYNTIYNSYFENGLLNEQKEFYFDYENQKFRLEKQINFTYLNNNEKEITSANLIHPSLPKNELSFLASYHGKYANQSKLFEKKAFTQRLKNLMGDRFDELYTKWMLETPIEVKNDVFVAKGSELHMPGIVDFIVIFDLKNNVMYAGMKNNLTYELFSENGKLHVILEQFIN